MIMRIEKIPKTLVAAGVSDLATVKLLIICLLVACETADSTPSPIVPLPPPPPPADAMPATPDAPPVSVNANCFANGPKEYIGITTDPVTGKGVLHRMTTGPVPDRYIRYTIRADGLQALELVFDGYEPGDYKRYRNAPVNTPREKLERGKSVVARVFVDGGKSYIAGKDVDLHTGMHSQRADHAYVCTR